MINSTSITIGKKGDKVEPGCTPQKSNGAPPALQARNNADRGKIEGLYVHVPFCFHKCHYCDFYSIVDGPAENAATHRPAREQLFVDRLIAELKARAAHVELKPRTIFVGGGTPTLLAADLWRRLLLELTAMGVRDRLVEWTVEANPETVTSELASVLAEGGVNRVSLGAQSFQPQLLKTLERWHEPANVARAVQILRAAGIGNINLDLIFATPGQTPAMLDADLSAALALAPTHLSCYSLIFEPNTALNQRRQQGQIAPVDEDDEAAMYEQVIDRLASASFEHYEVSNWARWPAESVDRSADFASPLRCMHNELYWRNENWLGVGPAAASHIDGHRWKNEAHLGRYLAHDGEPPTTDHECLSPQRSVGEQLMLRLRLREGVEIAWLHQHVPPTDPRRAEIESFIEQGFVEQTPTHVRLKQKGLFVADALLARLL